MIKFGESSSVAFNRTGVFGYHGNPDSWIKDTVTVMENQKMKTRLFLFLW